MVIYSINTPGGFMNKGFTIFATALLLSACASEPSINDAGQVAQAVTVSHDDFEKKTTYEAPEMDGELGAGLKIYLRAIRLDNPQETIYQIYVYSFYPNPSPANYSRAYDNDGNQLKLLDLDTQVVSCDQYDCSYDEQVAINVSKEYLIAHEAKGESFKIAGHGVSRVFYIPGAYIAGFMKAVNGNK